MSVIDPMFGKVKAQQPTSLLKTESTMESFLRAATFAFDLFKYI